MSLVDLIQQQLGPQEVQQISQQVGADPAQTEQAVQAALPMMLGGMAAGAREPQGASALGGLLGGGGGGLGGLLGGLGGMLGGGAAAGGAGGGGGGMDMGGILGSILGRSQPAVQDGVQQASGLNSDQTKKLMMILAPIVLGAIMKSRQNRTADGAASGGPGAGMGIPGMGGMSGMGSAPRADAAVDSDGDGIPDYLEQEARTAEAHAAQRNPKIGGIVGKILDMAQRPPR